MSNSNRWWWSSSEDVEEEEQQHDGNNPGSTEAGIVRGVSRSVAAQRGAIVTAGRRMGNVAAKMPQVGRLPRGTPSPKVPRPSLPKGAATATTATTRVPVRQVARITDRMSTGLDVWDAHSEQISSSKRRYQLRAFVTSLVKNTILGAIVFESYCWIVMKAAAAVSEGADTFDDDDKPMENEEEDEPPPTGSTIFAQLNNQKDVFETTPLYVHYVAGGLGGSLQGLGGILWDTTANKLANITAKNNKPKMKKKLFTTTSLIGSTTTIFRTMGQHAIAHSILFGSYETCKRFFLYNLLPRVHHHQQNEDHYEPESSTTYHPIQAHQSLSDSSSTDNNNQGTTTTTTIIMTPHQRLEYFLAITMAGGLAGQFQHVTSHLIEQQQQQQQQQSKSSNTKTIRRSFRLLLLPSSLPTLRSTLWSFPPSAIAFLAFEYGKDHVDAFTSASE